MEALRGYFNVPTHDNSDVFTKVTRIKISVLYNDFITKHNHINIKERPKCSDQRVKVLSA